jgi:two-component system response regulator YesN
MMKVFLVDDEIAIRENLRNSFPWEAEGFQLVGEAPDGEMALPMIRDLEADILLTDIRMPFMDGIRLCEEVQRTMPWVERIILSGYDDFAYAQKAMSLGVQHYLLKPVTAEELKAALHRVRLQIEEKRRDREHLSALRERVSHGNAFLRDKLLASLFTDEGDPADDDALLRQMRQLGVNLSAACYAVIDISFDAADEERTACRAALTALAEMSGGGVFTCGAPHGARALVLGDNHSDTEERAYSYANSAIHLPELAGQEELLFAVGETVEDYHAIRRSMKSARHVRHVQMAGDRGGRRIVGVDETVSPGAALSEAELSPLHERLQYASAEDVEAIVTEYTGSMDPSLALGYLRVAALLAAQRIIHEAGGDPREVLSAQETGEALNTEGEAGIHLLMGLLRTAIDYRARSGRSTGSSAVSQARFYLSRHFADPNLMLQDAAGEVHMSQSHFSTLFSQETGLTFTQYLTALRIGKAKELLATTQLRSSEIARQVGYNDAHYFSYLFKKHTGATPSDYRRGAGGEENQPDPKDS